jgi:hypothetical protein
LFLAAAPVLAHHSFDAEFDRSKPVKVTGVIKKVEWQNPHIWFYVEGKDENSGKTAVWGFSAGAPGTLTRRGIKRDVLKIGDTVKVDGFLAKDGSPNASGGQVTFADGRAVFTAAPEDAVPAGANRK